VSDQALRELVQTATRLRADLLLHYSRIDRPGEAFMSALYAAIYRWCQNEGVERLAPAEAQVWYLAAMLHHRQEPSTSDFAEVPATGTDDQFVMANIDHALAEHHRRQEWAADLIRGLAEYERTRARAWWAPRCLSSLWWATLSLRLWARRHHLPDGHHGPDLSS
jgi:hypothetical protein